MSVGQFGLLTAQFLLGAGDGHALAGAHADEIGFELGEGGEDIEEHLSHTGSMALIHSVIVRCEKSGSIVADPSDNSNP